MFLILCHTESSEKFHFRCISICYIRNNMVYRFTTLAAVSLNVEIGPCWVMLSLSLQLAISRLLLPQQCPTQHQHKGEYTILSAIKTEHDWLTPVYTYGPSMLCQGGSNKASYVRDLTYFTVCHVFIDITCIYRYLSCTRSRAGTILQYYRTRAASHGRGVKPGLQYDAGASVISGTSRWPTLESIPCVAVARTSATRVPT